MKEDFNKKINILNYWIDIESSTPPVIKTSNFTNKGDSKWNQNISFSHKDDLLWQEPLISNIENPENWVHKVFLGVFNTKHVIEEFAQEDMSEIKSTHDTCLVSFLIDGSGNPIKNTIQIPDYLKSIAVTTIEDSDEAKLFDVRIQDLFARWSHGIKSNDLKLDTDALTEFLHKILIELNWDLLADALNDGEFKFLAYSESINLDTIKDGSKPKFDTNDITSSLIVNDLMTVKKNVEYKIISSPLDKYLSDENFGKENKIDVIRNKEYFKEVLDLENLPLACWPFTGNYPLVSSQQFAVNNLFKEIDKESILSVNGPPGTGKTTLLKDVVANIIFKRAEQILKFKNDPKKAFKKIGETSLKLNSKTIQEIFEVDKSISGYEIVVASSNNGAVENITKEFPSMEEIDKSWHGKAEYLTEIASNIHSKESWGLVSASLGNKNNNYNFYGKFLYSKTDENGETSKSIFDYLKHPNYFMEKRISWEDACENLEIKIENVKNIKKETISIKSQAENYKAIYDNAIKSKKRCDALSKRITMEKSNIQTKISKLKENQMDYLILKDEFKKAKSSFFGNKNKLKKMLNDLKNDEKSLKRAKKEIELDKLNLKKRNLQFNKEKLEFSQLKESVQELKTFHKKYVEKANQEIPFDIFWSQDYARIQKSSPWYSKELNEARVEVFIASMDIHKAFMIENSSFISSNLNAFKQVLNNSFYEDEKLTRSIWETLFLIVPVVSTTFSSFENLFGDLLANSIGWLLIDEAGQATPQAPVGALWRSQRAIFVGDPLQVQPVVQIEDKLSDVLLSKNNVPKYWSSTMLSSQEIADRQNPFGTEIDLGEKKWVGMPLRVHRRCDEPMFSISNKIAYDNLMIFGKKRARPLIDVEKVLGKTSWIDIEGSPDKNSHWIPEEGAKIVEMLRDVCHSNGYKNKNELPSIYIITPFKNISFEIRRLLQKEKHIWMPKEVNTNKLDDWLYKSVGTIHSFQGEETDVVFLVLGGNISRPGAISWVCDEPNILNVATTRAKNAFYIIGNKKIWDKGVFGLIKGYIK